MADGRRFTEVDGQLMFLRDDHRVRFADVFAVKVGAVSGADHIFTHPKGNMEFVCSKTVDTGETRRMLYGIKHPHLDKHKAELLARRVKHFDESNWWQWGRAFPISEAAHLRQWPDAQGRSPSSCTTATASTARSWRCSRRTRASARRDLIECTMMLNKEVDWQQLGFVCDGRFLSPSAACRPACCPEKFSRYLPKDAS
jgi:adenine-specific DNA-methyltransferase